MKNTAGERGTQMVEAALVFVVFLGFLFLLMDAGWIVFTKATLQHAVREGVRYAITSQTNGGGHIASIRAVVKRNAMGLLSDADAASLVQVQFRTFDTQTIVTGPNSNQGGNLVIVSVESYQVKPIFPLLHSGDPIPITVRAGDRMEASPGGIAPAL